MRASKRFTNLVFLYGITLFTQARPAIASGVKDEKPNPTRPRSLIDLDVESIDVELGSSVRMTPLAHTSAALSGARLGLILNNSMIVGFQSYALANKIRPDLNKGQLEFRSFGIVAGGRSIPAGETIKTSFFQIGAGLINAHEKFTEQGRTYSGTGYYVEPELGSGIKLLPRWGLDFGAGYRFVSISGTPGYSGSDLTGLFLSFGTSVWF